MKSSNQSARLRRYEQITKGIVSDIEEGRATKYRSPWLGGGPQSNAKSGRVYEGLLNELILWCSQRHYGFRHTEWLTAKQAASLGGRQRKRERPTTIIFGKPGTSGGRRGLGRLVQVYNVEQCVGLPPGPQLPDQSWQWAFPRLERLIAAMQIEFRVQGTQAIYHPTQDYIQVPPPGLYYRPSSDWPRSVMHEICHATKHRLRLDRAPLDHETHVARAREEVLAELATTYVMGSTRMYAPMASVGYIKEWLHFAKVNSEYLFEIAPEAAEIADYVLGFGS